MAYGLYWNSNVVTFEIIMKNDRMFHSLVNVPKH